MVAPCVLTRFSMPKGDAPGGNSSLALFLMPALDRLPRPFHPLTFTKLEV